MKSLSKRIAGWMVSAAAVTFMPSAAAAEPASGELPEYRPTVLELSTLTSVGSDSMGDLVQKWVDAYRAHQPSISVQSVSRGSAAAPAALIEGSADLGPMARPMKAVEREEFISKYGFEPTQVRTAIAAVGVYVPSGTPLERISLEQLGRIYAAAEEGTPQPIVLWRDLGVTRGALADQPVVPITGDPASYLTGYFRQQVLRQRPFSAEAMTVVGPGPMAHALQLNPGAIAVSEIFPVTPSGMKLVPVQRSAREKAVLPTSRSIADGSYPLARFLNIYVVREPGGRMDPVLRDFLHFVLSREGQELVRKEGLTPLPAKVVQAERSKL